MSASAAPFPFDALADDYDASFCASEVGRRQRFAVWRRLDAVFAHGHRVLELGCGTGEDALHMARRGVQVLATDRSPAMLDVARRKLAGSGFEDRVELVPLAIEDLPSLADGPPFDGVLSNFGALNCVADLAAVGRALAPRVRSGGRVMLVIMGPLVPWEWLWFLLRGRPDRAFRRLRPGGVTWRGLDIRYPSIGTVRRALGPSFRPYRVSAVGALVPPTYVEPLASRLPRWVGWLDRLERRIERWPPLPWLADHYLLEVERR